MPERDIKKKIKLMSLLTTKATIRELLSSDQDQALKFRRTPQLYLHGKDSAGRLPQRMPHGHLQALQVMVLDDKS